MFFGTFPDPTAATRAVRVGRTLCGERGLDGKPLATGRLHVSLHHVGHYAGLPRGIADAAREAASAVALPPFDVAFDRAMSFARGQGRLPFVLRGNAGVAGLMMLHHRLGTAMRMVGLRRWVKAQYTPHVTLAYGDRRIVEHAIEAVRWTVRDFVLVHSLHGRTEYVVLGRWPLRG